MNAIKEIRTINDSVNVLKNKVSFLGRSIARRNRIYKKAPMIHQITNSAIKYHVDTIKMEQRQLKIQSIITNIDESLKELNQVSGAKSILTK